MSRISALPRRDWRALAAPFVEPLSALLRAPGGEQTLRPAQTALLCEAPQQLGAFVNGRMGIGKTAMAALVPLMLAGKVPEVRVLICCPGGIKADIIAHHKEMRQHWKVPAGTMILSYTAVSNMARADKFLCDLFGPGLPPTIVICDESEALKNARPGGSSVGAQFRILMQTFPQTVFITVTATSDVDGLLDYAHLLDWALRDRSPLPRDRATQEDWSSVIDAGDMSKALWVCQDLGIPTDSDLDDIRAAYRDRLYSTPGIIIDDSPFLDVDLVVREHVLPPDPAIEPHFERLRDLFQRPDGVEVAAGAADGAEREPDRVEGSTIWGVARRMGRGLCYVWDPLPPQQWLLARRKYFSRVRRHIDAGHFLTEYQVRQHCIRTHDPRWLAWERLRPSFTPQTKTLWLSDAALRWCEAWGAQGPGVIWCEDIAFGVELSRRTGWVYYGAKGKAPDGALITTGPRPSSKVVIASRRACGYGKNLQFQWSRCLFVTPPNKSRDFEQPVGRFHREGQTETVHADILLTCAEDWASVSKTIASARRTAKSMYNQKAAHYQWPHAKQPDSGRAFG